MTNFETPADGNYLPFKSLLKDKIAGACSSWSLETPSLSYGKGIMGGLSNLNAARRLEEVLQSHGEVSLGTYLAERAGSIVFVALAVVMLIVAIVACFALKETWRKRFSRWYCGACRSRVRPRLSQIKKSHKIALGAAVSFFGLGLLAVVALLLVSSTQMIQGSNMATCNTWLQMYGHFFGAEELSVPDPLLAAEMALSWSGTHQLHENMLELQKKVTPGETNPIYVTMMEGYNFLKEQSVPRVAYLKDITNVGNETMKAYAALISAATPPIDGPGYGRFFTLTGTIELKTDKFDRELQTTLDQGFAGIEELIEKYSGQDSQLMAKSSKAVDDSLLTISQIDAALAALVRLWDKHGGALGALLLTIASLKIVLSAVSLVALSFLVVAVAHAYRSFGADRLVSARDRKFLGYSYVTFAVVAGVSFLLASVNFLAATVGQDACTVIDDGLFTRGNWAILGKEILHPVPDMTVDMNTVFDTCIRRDGEGNVAVSVGLDGRIAELADDVDEAEKDIFATRERLLNRNENLGRVDVLGHALIEMLEVVSRSANVEDGADPIYFNETKLTTFEVKPYEDTLFSFIPFVVPQIKDKSLLEILLKMQDPVATISPLNFAIDYLNEVADFVHTHLTTTAFPTAFCTPILKSQGHLCGTTPAAETAWITRDIDISQFDAWTAGLDAGLPLFQGKYDRVGTRAKYLMEELYRTEFTGSMALSDAKNLAAGSGVALDLATCPDESTCTFNEARLFGRAKGRELKGQLDEGFGAVLLDVDSYVEDKVVPVMRSLVSDANELTENANCQFEGTVLDKAVVPSLCAAAFPAAALSTVLLSALAFIAVSLGAASIFWYHYFTDLALEYDNSSRLYQENADFTPMSVRKEFVAYTGVPVVSRSGPADADTDVETDHGGVDRVDTDHVVVTAQP